MDTYSLSPKTPRGQAVTDHRDWQLFQDINKACIPVDRYRTQNDNDISDNDSYTCSLGLHSPTVYDYWTCKTVNTLFMAYVNVN